MQTQTMTTESTDERARRANAADLWDKLWTEEGETSWRQEAMRRTYNRALQVIERNSEPGKSCKVVDLGGGRGFFAARVMDAGHDAVVVDISQAACNAAREKNLTAIVGDVNEWDDGDFESLFHGRDWVVATEFIEHLPEDTRHTLLAAASRQGVRCMFSVPNNRLGPDEEPQHTIKWSAKEFKDYLAQWFDHVRVEALGPYLLGVCGIDKGYKMSVCLPARDEAHDLESTLATYRGVADELVVGVDPRTVDNTREIAAQYADVVFDIEQPLGPPEERVKEGGVHFGHIRNECIRKCSGDWIFMTEAHERLIGGEDTLYKLVEVAPESAAVAFVLRHGRSVSGNIERWGFPWIFRNDPDNIYFKRSTHNVLSYPDSVHAIRLPEVCTMHERHEDNAKQRKEQRDGQNRRELMEDWRTRDDPTSLYYLGQEWRGIDDERACERLEQFIELAKGAGEAHYQARLMLAKMYWGMNKTDDARKVLLGCIGNDWSRIDHWVYLGDMAYHQGNLEEALQFYRYASTRIGEPPFTLWWIDLSMYNIIPAQRLAEIYGQLGRGYDALHWAKRVLELTPPDAPEACFEEAERNIQIIEEALNATSD